MKEKKSGQLRIAMLGHKRIPSREGGIEIVVEELSTRMVELGHAVTCYNRKGHHVSGVEFDGEERSEYKGVRLKTVPTIERKGLAAVTSSFFVLFLRRWVHMMSYIFTQKDRRSFAGCRSCLESEW